MSDAKDSQTQSETAAERQARLKASAQGEGAEE